MINLRRSRILVLSPVLCLALLGLAWLRFGGHLRQRALFAVNDNTTLATRPASISYEAGLIPFWDQLSKVLLEARPKNALPENPIEAPINNFAGIRKGSNFRPDLIDLPQQDVDELRDAHSRYVAQLPQLAPQLPYAKSTKGIVTTAAGEFMPILVVSLRMLRRTESKLPVHVFLESPGVYEPDLCERVLPDLLATCFILSDVLDSVTQKVEISRYQLKAFALLFSPLDDILLLDADNLAVERPEQLLDAEPFISKGFVSWPDYWANTASPKYYDISSQPIPSTSERAASESGQLLISKSKHASTLLLSLYYNYYGPSHYYKLLSQGAVSQGDKETYLAAAMSLNSTFYTVSTNIETLGYNHDDNQFKGCGAVQHNPSDDFAKTNLHNESTKEVGRSFVHAQTYKMDASKLPEVFQQDINQRMWGPEEAMVQKFGRDLEKQVWAETLYTGCQLEKSFRDWENKTGVCKKIGRVYKFLFD